MEYDEFAHEWQDLQPRMNSAVAVYPEATDIALDLHTTDEAVSHPPIIWNHPEYTVYEYILNLRSILEELSVLLKTEVPITYYFELVCYSSWKALIKHYRESFERHLKAVCDIFNDPGSDTNSFDGGTLPSGPKTSPDAVHPQTQVAV